MLDVRCRQALVIGGDEVAAGKAAALSACGARVTVLATEFCDELLAMQDRDEVTLHARAYKAGDLAGAFVVVAATNDPQLIEAIWSEAQQRGQLLNIVDVPDRCSFIVPSILRRGSLTIAVSTGGTNPSLAKRIRQSLEKTFPLVYDDYLRLAAVVRGYLRQQGISYEKRDAFFGEFYQSEILELLASGDEQRAVEVTIELLRSYQVEVAQTTLVEDWQAGRVRVA
jgi:precorrin-2 dehydrogenase/sirohydrochlorin ferrochelatase